jgi:hypothetical protein
MLALVRAGTPSYTRPLPVPPKGRDGGEVVRPLGAMRLRQEEGVVADPGLDAWPAPLGFRWASVARAFISCCIVGRVAC